MISPLRALIAALLLALVSCAAPPRELIVWHAYRGAERAALEALITDYNAGLPPEALKVRALAVPFEAYADKLSTALPRGRGPDMFIFAQDRLGGLAEGGALLPVGFWADDAFAARFLPGLMDAMTYRGVTYGVPLNFKSLALIRNTALMPEAPADTAALEAVARAFMKDGSGRFGLAYEYANADMHAALMHAFGGGAFDAEARPVLDQAANVRSFEFLLAWRASGLLPPEPTGAIVLNLFNQGLTPAVISGPWLMGEIAKDLPVAVSPLPDVTVPGGGAMKPWLIVEGVFQTNACDDPEAAFAFMAYLTTPEAARRLAVEGRQLPSVASVYDDPAIADDPVLSGFRAQLDRSVLLPNTPSVAAFWSPADIAIKQILRAGRPPAEALADAQASITSSLARLDGGERP